MSKMKLILRIAMVLALAFGTVGTANAQFGKLKNIAKKATDKVDKVKNNKVTNTVANVATEVSSATAPWPMNGEDTYKGMDMDQFVDNICSIPEEETNALRDALFDRYSKNLKIIKANANKKLVNQAKSENKEFVALYNVCIGVKVALVNNCVDFYNAEMKFRQQGDGYHMVIGRNGGGIGAYIFDGPADQQKFCDNHGNGIYLNDDQLEQAKELRDRMHRYKTFSHGLYDLIPETDLYGDDKDINAKMRSLFSRAAMSANALDVAINKNSPASIDRQARPKSGSLEKSLKAKALEVAKAQSSKVVDVIIKSSSWDVKKKGGVPTHRSVYGYYIFKDDQGLKCSSRMWQQNYQGNGKYGELRAGGVGVEPDFYIK